MSTTPIDKIAEWLDQAPESGRRNPLAMALATCTADGVPAVRMVLAKGFSQEAGHITFFTHFASRKGSELLANPQASAVMYWEEFGGRQLRIEGPVTRAPDEVADAYYATRPVASQLNAWVSEQSQPLPRDESLTQRLRSKATQFGVDQASLDTVAPANVPRPAHWGGFQLWIEQVEFWTEGAGRFHDRQVYRRSREAIEAGRVDSAVWQRASLQP